MDIEETPYHSIKLITIGNAYSGKTSITNVFCKKSYEKIYEPTIGVEFNSTTICDDNDDKYKLMFWDTAGQETFAPIIKSYYKNIAGIILVIDLSDIDGLRKIDYWLNEYKKNRIEACKSKIIVLGNKCDLDRKISKNDIDYAMKIRHLNYCEVSAKTGLNVNKAVMGLFKSIIRDYDKTTHPGFGNLNKKFKLQEKREAARSCNQSSCCITS